MQIVPPVRISNTLLIQIRFCESDICVQRYYFFFKYKNFLSKKNHFPFLARNLQRKIIVILFDDMKYSSHILFCDDDLNMSIVVADFLRSKGYDVDEVHDEELALDKIGRSYYDLCLLNLHQTHTDGAELLRNIHLMAETLPIIVFVKDTNLEAILMAYELGCDDYMVKPLSIDLLVHKIEAILRRVQLRLTSEQKKFQIGDMSFDAIEQTLNGKHLSARESDLLLMLCQNKDDVVDRHQILRSLWKSDDHFSSRSLCVYINHLRGVLAPSHARILAVHGRGYKLLY